VIGYAPPPAWADLAALTTIPLRRTAGDQALARPWMLGGERAIWFSRGAWALAALARASAKAKGGRAPIFWVPDYFCDQSLWPLRGEGAKIRFYPIGPDLAPDYVACREMAVDEPPEVFVLVHYFGHPADGAPAAELCREIGALLLEDAAHVLAPAEAIGNHGEFVLYSPYKTLGLPDGALLLARETPRGLEPAVRSMEGVAPSPRGWLLKRLVQMSAPRALGLRLAAHGGLAFDEDPKAAPLAATPRPSAVARSLLARADQGLVSSAERRFAQAVALGEVLAERQGWKPLFEPAPSGAAPYRLVMRCADEATAATLYARVRAGGGLVETWPDLPPEVRAAPERHSQALALRRTLLLFPVHHRIAPEALARLYRPLVA
jgi:hypothetical protein